MPVQSSSIANAQMLRDQTQATLDDLRAQAGGDDQPAEREALLYAATALGAFEAGLGFGVAELAARNPMRELTNPDSLLAQLYAVKVLTAESKAFFYAVLVFEGASLSRFLSLPRSHSCAGPNTISSGDESRSR
ncbi:hypothetical protein [Tabrizicola fusiformis]|uniref:hypothetical protein n=1 Tax=Tabrizicola sp. SY72 TaxID=2741673 RepID=UPI001571B176|nr:hypothetical protein [Tabrizicola sp. SY72]NTT88139.1 hypothetical protein [Tabrizicola sp. SY72]